MFLTAVAITLGYTLHGTASHYLPFQHHATQLPAPYQIKIAVENGSGDINYTRRVASRVASLGYVITSVSPAHRFSYRHTTVFYTDSGIGPAIGKRLADALDVELLPLPHGKSPAALILIVGQRNLAGN